MDEPTGQNPASLIIEAVNRILDVGAVAALITVIQAPAGVGAKLLVAESGEATGSLGDARLDAAAFSQALRFLESRQETRTLGPSELTTNQEERLDVRLLFERIQPEPRLVICGAGHVGASLAKLASFLNFRTTLIDDREQFLKRKDFPDERIELHVARSWHQSVLEAIGNGHGVSVAVVTRGHNEDEQCLRAVMETDSDYVGLIGSKRRTNIVLERLRKDGISPDKLGRVHAPIGLDIGAVTPEEVALAIMVEIVSKRRGGKGGSLSAWRRNE